MIENGKHRVTGRPTTTAACDEPDCVASYYLADGVGPHTGAEMMRGLGWDVRLIGTYHTTGYPSWCPEHAQVTVSAHEHTYRVELVYGNTPLCKQCGRPRP
jgi:hypothetical protein